MSLLAAGLALLSMAETAQSPRASVEMRDEESGSIIWFTPLCHPIVERAELVPDEINGDTALELVFRADVGEQLAAVTSENIGRTLPILMDNEVLSEPRIMEPIFNGKVRISPGWSDSLVRIREATLAPCDR